MKRFFVIFMLFFVLVGCSETDKNETDTEAQNVNNGSVTIDSPSEQEKQEKNSENASEISLDLQDLDSRSSDDDTVETNEAMSMELTEELKTYLFDNFGGAGNPEFATTWYKYIDDVEVSVFDDEIEVIIYTSIYPDDEGKELASKFFSPIWGWANNANDPKDVVFIKILGQDNRVLNSQTNPLN